MRDLVVTKSFEKKLKKYLTKHQDKEPAIEYVITKLLEDPYAAELQTHRLKGNLNIFYSSRIDYSHRLLFKMNDSQIILEAIGDHNAVY